MSCEVAGTWVGGKCSHWLLLQEEPGPRKGNQSRWRANESKIDHVTLKLNAEHVSRGRGNKSCLPWPCAAVAAAHAEAVDHGSSRKRGPPEASASRSTLCRAPPCTCGESAGNLLYPEGRGGRLKVMVRERRMCQQVCKSYHLKGCFVYSASTLAFSCLVLNSSSFFA